ncbi:hypothetical protein [Aeromicrobium flavum]|uniref:hypothetical protein n=1 Tax=Aeromicrobium flavum TaxID=416568 RepID=UPI0031D22B79
MHNETVGMPEPGKVRYDWTGFSRKQWGPVSVVSRYNTVEATVGHATIVLDLTDRRPLEERQRSPIATPFRDGVPVWLNGRRVATVRRDPTSPFGLFVRWARKEIAGDPGFVLPGMRLADRSFPGMTSLKCDAGTLVRTNVLAAPWNGFAWHYTLPGISFGAPCVAAGVRPEHIALWFAIRETNR